MKPIRIETSDLIGFATPPGPMNEEKVRELESRRTREGPNLSAISASRRGEERDQHHPRRGPPTNEEVNAAVSASPPRPCRAIGYPSKVGGHRPGLAPGC